MFARGSRYRNLSESTPINSKGERLRGKDLRFILPAAGIFLHTIRAGDRLDLLAFKYYGDSTRWWQISDANPDFAFPADLLDRSPVVDEIWAMVAPNFDARFQNLLESLAALAQVKLFAKDFLGSSVTLSYAAAGVRMQILNAIAGKEFHFLRSFAWTAAGSTIETFTFEDQAVSSRWRAVFQGLESNPGVLNVQSIVASGLIHVTYNSAMAPREALLKQVKAYGFDIVPQLSQTLDRPGEQIVVPPNGIA